MKLYKRMVKLIAIHDNGQGFAPDVKELTDWVDEDSPKLEETCEKMESKLPYYHFYTKEKFVEVYVK